MNLTASLENPFGFLIAMEEKPENQKIEDQSKTTTEKL